MDRGLPSGTARSGSRLVRAKPAGELEVHRTSRPRSTYAHPSQNESPGEAAALVGKPFTVHNWIQLLLENTHGNVGTMPALGESVTIRYDVASLPSNLDEPYR